MEAKLTFLANYLPMSMVGEIYRLSKQCNDNTAKIGRTARIHCEDAFHLLAYIHRSDS